MSDTQPNAGHWTEAPGQPQAENSAIAAALAPFSLEEILLHLERVTGRESNPGFTISEHLRSAVLALVNYDLYADGAPQYGNFYAYIADRDERINNETLALPPEEDDAPMPSRQPSELFKFAAGLARAHAELAIEASMEVGK